MTDNYITCADEIGTINISEEVISTIVRHSISEVEGVSGFSNTAGAEIADRIGPKVTVLMHYRSGSAGYEVLAPIEEASAVFGGACNVEKELVIDEEKLISGTFTIGY